MDDREIIIINSLMMVQRVVLGCKQGVMVSAYVVKDFE